MSPSLIEGLDDYSMVWPIASAALFIAPTRGAAAVLGAQTGPLDSLVA